METIGDKQIKKENSIRKKIIMLIVLVMSSFWVIITGVSLIPEMSDKFSIYYSILTLVLAIAMMYKGLDLLEMI